MRHDVVSALARPLLVSFLMSDKVTLSEKQRERFDKAQAAIAAPKVKALSALSVGASPTCCFA
jgi:hypothetical protein